MLKEEQAAEILTRCEELLGIELTQIRGNLRNARTRAAAVWELLVLEAASCLGLLEYEPLSGGTPDIRLHLPQGRTIWIEIAYLYPRFWKKERQSNAALQWLYKEAERRSIPAWKIHPRLDGNLGCQAGPVRTLPDLHELKRLSKEPELARFFEDVLSKPTESHSRALSRYTLSISYLHNARGPYLSAGGLAQEAPKRIKEHAVYRVLEEKARQHDVSPRVICIGSDQSPALSTLIGPGHPTVRDAVKTAFRKHHSLSAVITVSIRTSSATWHEFQREARGQLYLNPHAADPLTEKESELLCNMDFNRWKYTYPLQPWEPKATGNSFYRVSGSLTWTSGGDSVEIEVPANIVVDALAGKTSLAKEYRLSKDDLLARALNEGWVIEACSLKAGDIQSAESRKVVFRLVSPPLPVYRSCMGGKEGNP